MKVNRKTLEKIILEEWEYALQSKNPDDVEAVEDAWAGGDNLINPIDHAKVGGADAVTIEQETMEVVDESTRVKNRAELRSIVIKTLNQNTSSLQELKQQNFTMPWQPSKAVWSLFKDVGGDIGADLWGLIPVIGDASMAGAAMFNVWQLRRDMKRSERNLKQFVEATQTRDQKKQVTILKELAEDLDALNVNFWDFFQRVLSAVPIPGPGEALSALSTWRQAIIKLKQIKAVRATGLVGKKGFKGSVSMNPSIKNIAFARTRVSFVVQPLTELMTLILDHPDTPDAARGYIKQTMDFVLGVPNRMILIQDVMEDFEDQQRTAASEDIPFEYILNVVMPEEISPQLAILQDPRRSGKPVAVTTKPAADAVITDPTVATTGRGSRSRKLSGGRTFIDKD